MKNIDRKNMKIGIKSANDVAEKIDKPSNLIDWFQNSKNIDTIIQKTKKKILFKFINYIGFWFSLQDNKILKQPKLTKTQIHGIRKYISRDKLIIEFSFKLKNFIFILSVFF